MFEVPAVSRSFRRAARCRDREPPRRRRSHRPGLPLPRPASEAIRVRRPQEPTFGLRPGCRCRLCRRRPLSSTCTRALSPLKNSPPPVGWATLRPIRASCRSKWPIATQLHPWKPHNTNTYTYTCTIRFASSRSCVEDPNFPAVLTAVEWSSPANGA